MLKAIGQYFNNISKCISVKKAGISVMLVIVAMSFIMPTTIPDKKLETIASQEDMTAVAQAEFEKAKQPRPKLGEVEAKESRKLREEQVTRGNLNRNEVTLLAMVIEGEAADEPYKGKVAVAAVILNRMDDDKFPDTLSGVVYQKLAFESVMNNQYKRPLTEESIKAAQEALNGSDPTGGALYFWNPITAKSKWIWSRPITDQIGRHVFAK